MKQVSLAITWLTLIVFTCLSCKKSEIASGIPSCIRKQIKATMNDPNSMISDVKEYLFQNRTVYGFNEGLIADGQIEIKDESCNILCRVGGFGGPGLFLCNGDNFFQTAVLKRNIWTRK
jgi:hypothetical protein